CPVTSFTAPGFIHSSSSIPCRMYQALMASSDFRSAAKVLTRIPKDDSHVRSILLACKAMYGKPIEKDIKDKIVILKKKKRVK
ncbi:hypothetical protein AKJ16_DCAP07146, partial [Drosera capensis]